MLIDTDEGVIVREQVQLLAYCFGLPLLNKA